MYNEPRLATPTVLSSVPYSLTLSVTDCVTEFDRGERESQKDSKYKSNEEAERLLRTLQYKYIRH